MARKSPTGSLPPAVPLAITPTFRPWTHTSDDSYFYQLSLVVATATVSFNDCVNPFCQIKTNHNTRHFFLICKFEFPCGFWFRPSLMEQLQLWEPKTNVFGPQNQSSILYRWQWKRDLPKLSLQTIQKRNRLKIRLYRRYGEHGNKMFVFLGLFVDAAVSGATCVFTLKIVSTPIKNSSRDDRPSIST